MPCSAAKLEANRRNAARSTGPRTEEGKEASRANALKHGLRAEVVVPEGHGEEVARRSAVLEAELRPSGELGRILVHRIAAASLRMERGVRHEAAQLDKRVRDAGASYDDAKRAEIEKMGDWIAAEPATHVRRLKQNPEGLDWLLKAWRDLKSDLFHPTRDVWGYSHRQRVDNLMGRRPEEIPWSPLAPLCRASWGEFDDLEDHQGTGLSPFERKMWARHELGQRIDAEVEALETLREQVARDSEARDRDRAEAADRALFDPSRDAILARRYESAAEREMHRALREFRQVEADAASARADGPSMSPEAPVSPTPDDEPLASFGANTDDPHLSASPSPPPLRVAALPHPLPNPAGPEALPASGP